MARYFHITTMGCQMNSYDSDYLNQVLVNSNFVPTEDPKAADLILINTCTVRAKAEQKAFSILGRMASLKKRKPGLILGIMGCIAQQEGANLVERFPELDLVLGTRVLGRIDAILEKVCLGREKVVATEIDLEPFRRPVHCNGYFKGRLKGFISIMEGCDNACSYCIVPYVRGREVSRSPQDIIAEAKYLVSQGVREITLLGQNVNSYCWGRKTGFSWLLEELDGLRGLERLRFTTSHPKDLSDQLISCFEKLDSLCPHIHLPFQAGSNRILELMNRGYTRERYMELVTKLRQVRPDIAITSDVMVGFPGESEEDFQMTLGLIRKVEFDGLFSFKYSDRKGTLAEKMKEKIDEQTKSSRLIILQAIQKAITLHKNTAMEGSVAEVLVEGQSKRGGQLTGRTATDKIVNFSSNNKNIVGKLVKVRITEGFSNSLRGELMNP